jgi:hypothetical protein
MNFKINFNKKEYFIYLFLYISLIIGFYLNENTIGGAEYDSGIIFNAIKSFSVDLNVTYKNYYEFKISHFPFYYIFLSQILKLSESIIFTKIVVLHFGLFLPYIFYKIIKFRYDYKNKYLIYLPGIIFLSPSYRSSSIWGLNDNIALIFFGLSVLFYLKFAEEKLRKKKIIYILLNALMLAMAAYTRQYYAIFSIYFFYKLLEKFDLKIIQYYIFTNLILASYAIKLMFFNDNFNYASNFITNNLSNNITLSVTMFIIYLLPVICNKDFFMQNINYYQRNKNIFLISFFLIIILCFFFNYKVPYGGGIIYKIIYNFNSYLYLLIFALCSLILNYFLSENYRNNFILIFCLFLAVPTEATYQKYFDPLCIILIFSLFDSIFIKKFINNLKFIIKYLYIYFFLIYFGYFIYKYILI